MTIYQLMEYIENDINGYFYTKQGNYELFFNTKDKWVLKYYGVITFHNINKDNVLEYVDKHKLSLNDLIQELNSTASAMALYYKGRYEDSEKLFGKEGIENIQSAYNGLFKVVSNMIHRGKLTLLAGGKEQ